MGGAYSKDYSILTAIGLKVPYPRKGPSIDEYRISQEPVVLDRD